MQAAYIKILKSGDTWSKWQQSPLLLNLYKQHTNVKFGDRRELYNERLAYQCTSQLVKAIVTGHNATTSSRGEPGIDLVWYTRFTAEPFGFIAGATVTICAGWIFTLKIRT